MIHLTNLQVVNFVGVKNTAAFRLHLCPGLNAGIVKSVLRILHGYLTFHYYFIFDISIFNTSYLTELCVFW